MGEGNQGEIVIGLDFDGVLHNYTEWTGVKPEGPPVEGALEAVTWMLQNGFKLEIFSARANHAMGEKAIEEWLVEHGFPAIPVSLQKPIADLYVDDRGFRFEGPQSFGTLIQYLTRNPKPGRWGKGKSL